MAVHMERRRGRAHVAENGLATIGRAALGA